MDVLIAHRGQASRTGLAKALEGQGYDLLEAGDGGAALDFLLAGDAPGVAIIDWDLPAIDGPELGRLVRDFHLENAPYVILPAAGAHHSEVALGLEAGANDCVRTPVTAAELRARVDMGRRLVEPPWGRTDAARAAGDAAGGDGGARSGEVAEDGFEVSLRAFIDADAAGADDPDPGGRVELQAVLGDRSLMAY
jgi:DNA-binding response OmpR family regulator